MYGGRYSRIRYSLREGEYRLNTSITAVGKLHNRTGAAKDIYSSPRFQTELRAKGRTGTAILREVYMPAELHSGSRVLPVFLAEVYGEDRLAGCSYLAADLKMESDVTADMACAVYSVQDIFAGPRWADSLDTAIHVVQDLFGGGIFSEILSAVTQSAVLDEETLLINVTIPPGGELRIDTEYFTALLNGANILHLYNGSWPELTRSMLHLQVDSGTGGALEGEVIFTERWY